MPRLLPSLRACAAAFLLFAGGMAHAAPLTPAEQAIATLQAAFVKAVAPGEQADLYRDLVATVINRLHRSYATEVDMPEFTAAALKVLEPLAIAPGDAADVFKKAINTALRTLDAYSRYLDMRAYGNERTEATGRFVGLGVQLESASGVLRVVSTLPEGPAARLGLLAGDVILRIDDIPVEGVPLPDAIGKLRGPVGTTVLLAIQRPGSSEELTLAIPRESIRRQLVRWNMEGDVLVLRVASFTGPVTSAMRQAIADATVAGMPQGVVLDLRGNPGGLLREGVQVADSFLNKGDIVSVRGRLPGTQRVWQADADEVLPGVPMVVLVDGRSASASELVADALQDNGRAKVIGQRSYGKGSVQVTYALGEERRGALKLTTSLYHGPSGRTVQKTGVMPDIEVVNAAAPPVVEAAAVGSQAMGAAGAGAAGAGAAGAGAAGAGAPAAGAAGAGSQAMGLAAAAVAAARPDRVRIEQGRCPVWKSADPVLSCAVTYLQAGSLGAFLESVGELSH